MIDLGCGGSVFTVVVFLEGIIGPCEQGRVRLGPERQGREIGQFRLRHRQSQPPFEEKQVSPSRRTLGERKRL